MTTLLERVYHPTEFGRAHLYALEQAFQHLESQPKQALIIEFETEAEKFGLQHYVQTYNPNLIIMESEEMSHVIITTS